MNTATRRIAIDPVTRIEGHARVTIDLDAANKVQRARMHVVEFRGFERFIQGRPFWEVSVIVQRLCGICPVSHQLCASKAMDMVVGADKLTPVAEKVRRLMHYGQMLQSHALHFFHLSSPDLLFGFDAPAETRNVVALAKKMPELATKGVLLRKYGQEIIKATAGKKIHGTGAVPGGVNKNLSVAERDTLLEGFKPIMGWSREAVEIAKNYTLENFDRLSSFGAFESNYLSIVDDKGGLDLYDGNLKAIDANGKTIFEGIRPIEYNKYIAEEVRDWSYLKFPFIRSLGKENGWYRVGPLARLNTASHIDTPAAEAARRELKAVTNDKPNHVTMGYHWARMIEMLHAAEKIDALLHDSDLQQTDLVTTGKRRREGVGVLEAPRGTLFHHYEVDENDQVVKANLIVSTTSNNEPMNRSVQKVANDHISGQAVITEGLLNHIEVAIRAYDPCLSCATHALGQMDIEVELRGPDGAVLDRRGR